MESPDVQTLLQAHPPDAVTDKIPPSPDMSVPAPLALLSATQVPLPPEKDHNN